MKYYLQGGLYKTVVVNYCRDALQLGYAIDDFKFIVYSRSDKYPFVWNMSYNWHLKAMDGFVDDRNERCKGINELIEEYRWHVDNDYYNIEKIFIENEYLEL